MIWLLGGYMWLFIHRPFEVWPILGDLQVERAYMIVMLLAWVVSPRKGFSPNRLHVALGLFAVIMTLAWLASPHADLPSVSLLVENYFKVAVFYVLVVTTVRDERDLRLLLLLFLGVFGLYTTHSLLEFVRGRYQYRMGIPRMVGVDQTYSDPNAFAATLVYTLPLALPFWLEQPRRLPRWLMLGFAGLMAGCVLLTGSRGGFLGLCICGMFLLWLSCKRKGPLILLSGAGAVVMAGVLTVALPAELQNRYLTIVDSSRGPANAQESAEGRMAGFLHGIELWQKSPLLGHGPGSFAFATGAGFGAHNLYGQVLGEMGTLGALALLGMLAAFALNWREMRRLYRSHPPRAGTDGGPGMPHDFTYNLCRSLTLNVVLLLMMGCAGHNLFRYQWQWFAAFQVVALHCARVRARAAQSTPCALPELALPAPPLRGWSAP